MHIHPFQNPTCQHRIRVLIQIVVILSLVLTNFLPLQSVSARSQDVSPTGQVYTKQKSIEILKSFLFQSQDCQPDLNGDLILAEQECSLSAGSYTFNNILIGASGKLQLIGNSVTGQGVEVTASNITVEATGMISADGTGYISGKGPGGINTSYQTGGSHGGYGGYPSTISAAPYGSVFQPISLGSGGGSGGIGPQPGGYGGGAVRLLVDGTLTINGTISANGQSKPAGGAGGAGGSIWIAPQPSGNLSLVGSGVIQANGGNGSAGGGGGRIAIYGESSTFFGNVRAYGGTGRAGGPGTIYWGPENRLVMDNNGIDILSAGLTQDNYSFSTLELNNGGNLLVMGADSSIDLTPSIVVVGGGKLIAEGAVLTEEDFTLDGYQLSAKKGLQAVKRLILTNQGVLNLYAQGSPTQDGTFVFDQITVNSGTTLGLFSYANYVSPYNGDQGVTLVVNEFLTVDGRISADGTGYISGKGPGGINTSYQTGGSHGGYGGYPSTISAAPYGSVFQPISLGSGGGSGGTGPEPGGYGGGAVRLLVDGTLTINGTISANGESKTTGGAGGAGGSIWIAPQPSGNLSLVGSGVIQANGGSGYSGGSGGRIAIYGESSTFPANNVLAEGGNKDRLNTTKGENGTVYFDEINITDSTITITPETVIVGDYATISMRIVDNSPDKNPISNKLIEVGLDSGDPVSTNGTQLLLHDYITIGTTDSLGIVTGQITTEKVGIREIVARDAEKHADQLLNVGQVTFTNGPISGDSSSIVVSPGVIAADGGITETGIGRITVSVRDSYGNPVPGKQVILTASENNQVSISQPAELTNAEGNTEGLITSLLPQDVEVYAKVLDGADEIVINQEPPAIARFRGVELEVHQRSEAPTNQGTSSTIATAGYPITYIIDISNRGAAIATGVVIADTLPEGLAYQSGSSGCSVQGQVVTCLVGELAASATKRITLTAGIASDLTGQISNAVEATGEGQPVVRSDMITEVVAPQSALTFQVQAVSPYVQPGGTTSVTVQLVNRGLAPTIPETINLQGPLSSWVSIEPASLPALAKDETAQVTITIAPPADQTFGQYQGLLTIGEARMGMTVLIGQPQQVFTVNVNTDSATPLPVSGAQLQLVSSGASYVRVDLQGNTSSYLPVYSGKSDGNGQIVFDKLEAGSYTYNLSASYHDPESGTLQVGGGAPDTVTLSMMPYGKLYLEKYQRIMTVRQDGQVDQTLILRNKGAAPIDGLAIQLEPNGGQALPDWVHLILPSPIPVLQPGDQLPITISAQPGAVLGDFPILLHIQRESDVVKERIDIPAPINLLVSTNATRDVLFSVVDQTVFDPATQALVAVQTHGRVVVTRVRPQPLTLDGQTIQYQPQYSLPLSGNGQALFTDLEIGETYLYQMWADNYDYQEGSLLVLSAEEETIALVPEAKMQLQLLPVPESALQTLAQEHQIPTAPQPFIYTWRVVEGTTDLTYKLELTINNPDGSMVTQRPVWCSDANGCHWSSAGEPIVFGGSSGGGWYSIPRAIPRPKTRLASIRLSQSIVLSWQMFTGSLWLKNTSNVNLDNMQISVLITGTDGASRNADFTIQAVGQAQGVEILTLDDSLVPGAELNQDWQILPLGVLIQPTNYNIYAQIEYDMGGVHYRFVTTPEGITVNPAPKLSVLYTVPVSESPCGVFDITASITNVGPGEAKDLRIDSQPPRVTTLGGGLPITAQIVEARIGELVQPNALALALGDLPSGETVEAAWTIHTNEPVAVMNVTGLFWQASPEHQKISAISDFQVRMEPASCRSVPVRGTCDSEEDCETSYQGTFATGGGPINTRTGIADFSTSDLSLATYAGSLEFKRWYSTGAVDTFQEPFSPGWVHNQDVRLVLPPPGKNLAQVKLSSTNLYEFYFENGQYNAFPGLFGTLERRVADTMVTYVFKRCNQWEYTFDSSGRVISYLDTLGKGFLYEYDAKDRMWKIHDNHPDPAQQRGFELQYDPISGKLAKVSDSASREVRFDYDDNGDLQYAYDVQGQGWVYTYTSAGAKAHLLQRVGVEIATSQGLETRIIERNVYNDKGQVTAQYNGNDELIVGLSYGPDGTTTITDGLGNVSTHQYSIYGTLVGQTSPLGDSQAKDYSRQFRPTTLSDPNGNLTRLEWDSSNNQATLSKVTDAAGGSFHLEYDSAQNLTGYTDPLGNASSYTYDGMLLMGATDAQGNVTAYDYTSAADAPQPAGLLKQVTTPTGQVTVYHYNSLGQMEWVQQDGLQTSYAYDALGRVTRVTSPTGSVHATCYDDAGQVTRSVSSASAPSGDPCDPAFQPRPEDQVSENFYDGLGNLIGSLGPDGILNRTFYDSDNRPIRFTQNLKDPGDPNATTSQLLALDPPPAYDPAHPSWNLTSETRYDAAGNVIATIGVDGAITRSYYDALQRVAYTVQNLAGQTIEINTPPPDALRNAEQNLTYQMVYDANSNSIATIQLRPGCVVTEGQDAEGIATLAISAGCMATRTYYDVLDRPFSTVQNWRGENLLDPTPPQPESSRQDRNQRSDTVYDAAGNAIARISVLPGCEVTRTVDASGNPLVTTTSACIVDRSYYDSLNRIEFSVRSLVGLSIETPAYAVDGSLALLALERTSDQNLASQMVYDADGRTFASIELLPGCTVSRTANGAQWIYTASEACLVTRTYYDAQGRARLTVQNLRGQALDETLTEPPAYDPNFPDQNVPGSQPVFDTAGRAVASVDPLGRVNRTYFDLLQRPHQQTQNLTGQAIAVETPPAYSDAFPDQNVTAETRYDPLGRAIASIDPLGNITRTYYDTLGRAFRTTRNLNEPALTTEALLQLESPPGFDLAHPDWNLTTETVYDAAGRAIASIHTASPGCAVSYHADGTVTASAACDVTRRYYDGQGRVYATVERLTGQAITDASVPATNLTNETNLRSFTLYDATGQAIAAIAPDANCSASRASDGRWTVGAACVLTRNYYDELGRVVTTVGNLRGQEYQVETPPAREPRQASFPYYEHPDQNLRVDAIYDAAGNLVEQVDAEGIVTHFGYDRQGRLTDVFENYLPGVAPTERINVHTIYSYDAQGNRRTIQSARAVLAGTGAVTHFDYDALGRQVGERDPLNHGQEYGYDVLGRRAWQQDAYGLETRYAYDGLDRLVGITYPAPDAAVSFRYGPSGLRLSMTDGLGDTTWEYDDLGRILAVTDPFGKTVAYQYNGQSNRTRLTYPDGKMVHYAYDDRHRLETVTDWQNQITSYIYNETGRLDETHLPNGVISRYAYDPAGRLLEIQHALGEQLLSGYYYHYDRNGNRLRAVEDVRQPGGSPTGGTPPGWVPPSQFAVEQQGYLAVALGWPQSSLAVAGYTLERSTDGTNWQPIAELSAETQRYVDYGLARHTDYTYRLTASDGQGGEEVQIAQTSDSGGFDPVDLLAGAGDLVSTTIDYAYDPLQRLTAAEYDSGPFFHYEYDANGNRTAETTAAGRVVSVYDTSNRLTSVGGTSYTWDGNGNLLGDGTSSYQYDHGNRLVQVTKDGVVTSFGYNGLGDRLEENGARFVMDLNLGLTQVLQDANNTYLYGNGRIAQRSANDSAFFLNDALSSVRQLVDTDGAVTLAKQYEPYGEMLGSVGGSDTKYGFTGEWQSSTNLQYLRARWYSPQDSRFLTRDSWQGDHQVPISLNAWLYVFSNPINLVDPKGTVPCYMLLPQDQDNCKHPPNRPFIPPTDPHDVYHNQEGYVGSEKVKPDNIRFIPGVDPLRTGAPGLERINAAQFIKVNGSVSYNLCGLAAVAAILHAVNPGKGTSVLDVAMAFNKYYNNPKRAHSTYGPQELQNFINATYSDDVYSPGGSLDPKGWYWTHWVGNKANNWSLLPGQIMSWMYEGAFPIVSVEIVSGSQHYEYGGLIGYTDRPSSGTKRKVLHWVVVTGISSSWEAKEGSGNNWIRVYNPFDNETEYYWWPHMKAAWGAQGGGNMMILVKRSLWRGKDHHGCE